MKSQVVAIIFASMLAAPAWAHMDEACLEAIVGASRGEAKVEDAEAKCLNRSSRAGKSGTTARSDNNHGSTDTGQYAVDPAALTENPDEEQLRAEIIEYFLRPCHAQVLRSQGVKENMITIMLPRMQKSTMELVPRMIDQLVAQLKDTSPGTRAATYEVNYEACLRGSGVK